MLKRWRIGLLGFIVSILAIVLMLQQVDMQLLGEAVRSAHYIYLLPTFLLLVIALIPRALRWRVLLGGALPLYRAFSIMNVAYLVNGILPLRIGEVARAFLANRAGVPVFKSASTIIVERLLDLLAVLVLIGIALASAPLPDDYRAAASFFAPTVFVGFLTLIFLASQRNLAHRILNSVINLLPPLRRFASTFSAFLDHFLDGLIPLTSPRLLLLALFWTALSWGFSVLAGYIVMLTFFEQASLAAACLYIAAAAFAIAVPAVPGNIGTYELSIVLALGALGYGGQDRPELLLFAVIVHGTNLVVHMLTGVLGFVQEGITLEQLSSGVQQMRGVSAPSEEIEENVRQEIH